LEIRLSYGIMLKYLQNKPKKMLENFSDIYRQALIDAENRIKDN
jgi:hypothetical protein